MTTVSTAASSGSSRPRRQIRMGKLWIDAVRFDEALEAIEELVDAGQGGSVFTPNVDHVVTAEDEPAFAEAYAGCSLSLADGQPILWAARLLGTPLPEKISGSDLVWPLLQLAAARGWRVYFLGGAPGVAAAAAERVQRELGLSVVGTDDSMVPLRAEAGVVDPVLERVREARPDLVLVCLGAPKQELWIARSMARLAPAVTVGMGASLDFVAGRIKRAPRWISSAGLEWLWRLVREPRRLARRYLVKDPRFALVAARAARLPRADRQRERGAG